MSCVSYTHLLWYRYTVVPILSNTEDQLSENWVDWSRLAHGYEGNESILLKVGLNWKCFCLTKLEEQQKSRMEGSKSNQEWGVNTVCFVWSQCHITKEDYLFCVSLKRYISKRKVASQIDFKIVGVPTKIQNKNIDPHVLLLAWGLLIHCYEWFSQYSRQNWRNPDKIKTK